MEFEKKVLVFLLVLLFFIQSGLALPEVSIETNNLYLSVSEIKGQVSPGVRLVTLVGEGGTQIGSQDILLPDDLRELEIGTSQFIGGDINVYVGSNVRIKNEQGQETIIEIGEKEKTLEADGIWEVGKFDEGEYAYTMDGVTGWVVAVYSQGVDYSIPIDPKGVFEEGANDLVFEFRSLIDGAELHRVETQIDYQPYQNIITAQVENGESLTREEEVTITGSISIMGVLKYDINGNPKEEIEVSAEGTFEFEAKGLEQGENIITISQEEGDAILGEKKLTVTRDTIKPELRIIGGFVGFSEDEIYTNEPSISMDLYSDGSRVEYSFNGREEGFPNLEGGEEMEQVENIGFLESFSTKRVENPNRLQFDFEKKQSEDVSKVMFSYFEKGAMRGLQEVTFTGGRASFSVPLEPVNYDAKNPMGREERKVQVEFHNDDGKLQTKDFYIHSYTFDPTPVGIKQAQKVTGREPTDWRIENENLKQGENFVIVKAYDEAGNINKISRTIILDGGPPGIVEINPPYDKEKTQHSIATRISGRTNRFVEGEVFTFVRGEVGEDGITQITCGAIEKATKDKELRDKGDDTITEEDLSILNSPKFITRQKFKTDDAGNFKNIIIQFKGKSSEIPVGGVISSVETENVICFILKDKFGSTANENYDITYDAGNTAFIPSEITTAPNTVYSAEIEQTGDVGRGLTRVGLIVNFNYAGGGEIREISSVSITRDRAIHKESAEIIRVVQSELQFSYTPSDRNLMVYIPLELKPIMNRDKSEYPDKLDIALQAHIRYVLYDTNIPVDTQNPVYFQTQLNVERPLDHTKFLTPERLDKGIEFLNKSISWTQGAANVFQVGTLVGIGACTVAKIWLGVGIAGGVSGADLEERKKKVFYVCDRVICSPSPRDCGDGKDQAYSFVFGSGGGRHSVVDEAGEVLTRFENIQMEQNDKCEKGEVAISADVTNYQRDKVGWVRKTTEIERLIHNECVEGDDESVNLGTLGTVCYSEEPPKFDQARCFGQRGLNSKDNIIESIRCGCVTDTYSHLKNLEKIQLGIKRCLEQVKLGVSPRRASYCERLVAQATCDIVTNVLFELLPSQEANRQGEESRNLLGIGTYLTGAHEGDRILNKRYEDSEFYTQFGFSSDQIANKACLWGITGDWSVLTANLASAIEKNDVKPTFGPMFPESRQQGYNPFTGELSIRYFFTYGAISGGQHITSRVRFICYRSRRGGDFCPDDITYSDAIIPPLTRTLSVIEDSSRQESVVVTDQNARFRYNVVEITHEYLIDSAVHREVYQEEILHKEEFLLASCHFTEGVFGSGAGISCDRFVHTSDALTSFYELSNAELLPLTGENVEFYKGDPIFVRVFYNSKGRDVKDNQQEVVSLRYEISCDGEIMGHNKELSKLEPEGSGYKVLELDSSKIPFLISGGDFMECVMNLRFEPPGQVDLRLTNVVQQATPAELKFKLYDTGRVRKEGESEGIRNALSILRPVNGGSVCIGNDDKLVVEIAAILEEGGESADGDGWGEASSGESSEDDLKVTLSINGEMRGFVEIEGEGNKKVFELNLGSISSPEATIIAKLGKTERRADIRIQKCNFQPQNQEETQE